MVVTDDNSQCGKSLYQAGCHLQCVINESLSAECVCESVVDNCTCARAHMRWRRSHTLRMFTRVYVTTDMTRRGRGCANVFKHRRSLCMEALAKCIYTHTCTLNAHACAHSRLLYCLCARAALTKMTSLHDTHKSASLHLFTIDHSLFIVCCLAVVKRGTSETLVETPAGLGKHMTGYCSAHFGLCS